MKITEIAGFNPRSWMTGRCFDFALALHERMPDAEFVAIGSPKMPEHVALKRGNVYYDARGPIADPRTFLDHHIGDWTGDPTELIVPVNREHVELHAGVAGIPPPYKGNKDIAEARHAVAAVYGSSKRLAEGGVPENIMQDYSYGRCMWLSLALNRRFGWPIVAQIRHDAHGDFIAHSYNIMPDGREIDILGPQDHVDTFGADEIKTFTPDQMIDFINRVTFQGRRQISSTELQNELSAANRIIDQYVLVRI